MPKKKPNPLDRAAFVAKVLLEEADKLRRKRGQTKDSRKRYELAMKVDALTDHAAMVQPLPPQVAMSVTPLQAAFAKPETDYSSNAPLALADDVADEAGDPSFPDEDFDWFEDDDEGKDDFREEDQPQLGVKPEPVV